MNEELKVTEEQDVKKGKKLAAALKENPANMGPNAVNKKRELLKQNLKYMRDKDRELVRGKFHYHEVPNGVMEFSYRKYKEDELENFKLYDGVVYEIPRGVAKHLNTNCSYPIHEYYSQENNNVAMKVGKNVRRCSFQRLDFMDDEELEVQPNLYTVEHVPQRVTL